MGLGQRSSLKAAKAAPTLHGLEYSLLKRPGGPVRLQQAMCSLLAAGTAPVAQPAAQLSRSPRRTWIDPRQLQTDCSRLAPEMRVTTHSFGKEVSFMQAASKLHHSILISYLFLALASLMLSHGVSTFRSLLHPLGTCSGHLPTGKETTEALHPSPPRSLC